MKRPLEFFILLIFAGCSGDTVTTQKGLKQGVILYEISYPKMSDDQFVFPGMMPETMTIKFKDNKVTGELSLGFSALKTKFISDSKKHEFAHIVSMANSTFGVKMTKEEVKEHYAFKPDGMEITETGETTQVAGYLCKKAKVIFPDATTNFDIFFTNDLSVKNANWATPFYEIEGILMEYRLNSYNIDMHFKAIEVRKEKVDDSEFQLPEGITMMTTEEMEEKFFNLNFNNNE